MAEHVLVEIEMPDDLAGFKLPEGVDLRLQTLLDRQDQGETLSEAEKNEAEGLVNLSEWLSLLRLRSERISEDHRLIQIATGNSESSFKNVWDNPEDGEYDKL